MGSLIPLVPLEDALRRLGQLAHGGMLIHHALALLTIARREPVTYKQLEALLGLSNAAVSRTVNSLSTDVRHRKVGLGLVEISRDKHEGRRHVVELSPAGRELVAELSALMGPPA